jgi:hypothetical protein
MRRWLGGVMGGGLLALALAEAAMRHPPAQIRAGQPFIDVLYVDVFQRLPLLPVWVIVMALVWGLLRARRGGRVGGGLGWALGTVAVAVFALVSPVIALLNGSNVVHVTALHTDSARYVLYVEPSLRQSCDAVLARCDGLVCRYLAAYNQPICLGRNSPYRLTVEGDVLVVWYGSDEVDRLPR